MGKNLIGGILLIVGTSIGGGMLALPMAVAAGSYAHASGLFLFVWVLMTISALFILEVNLWFPEGSNLISMARNSLGRFASAVTWLVYLVLYYTLLSAYTAGGADIVSQLSHYVGVPPHSILNRIIFSIIMAFILYFGVVVVDHVNRVLMYFKLVMYVVLVAALFPKIKALYLWEGHFWQIKSAVMVVVTSFGYGAIIPTLRSYFKGDVKQLRLAIIIGSFIPLVCYLLWNLVVRGSMSGSQLLIWSHQDRALTQMTESLANLASSHWLSTATQLFTTLCVSTSFLGVALGLTDFVADGLKVKKQGWALWLVLALTVLPPLIAVIIDPAIFIPALVFAGLLCIYLLMFLPSLMTYMGRYHHQGMAKGYRVFGGKLLVSTVLVISVGLMIYAVVEIIPNVQAMVG